MKPVVSLLILVSWGCGKSAVSSDGGNSPPSIPEIDITPADPSGADDLVVTLTTPSIDPDGDEVEYRVRWSLDGEEFDELTSLALNRAFTNKGDTWSVEVSAFDGILGSAPAKDSVDIVNSLPTVDDIVVSPENPTVTDELICTFGDPIDLDNDEVSTLQSWAVNGEPNGIEGPLSGEHFAKGDEVQCLVYAQDGDADVEPFRSDAVRVINSAPRVTGCRLSPPNPPNDVDVNGVVEDIYDPDGDEAVVLLAWYRNGVLLEGYDDTLPANMTSEGDRLNVECTAWDGETIGNTVKSADGTVGD